ncbi:hypothetical protein AACH06_26750 [Ideonella sp. DXS29W]|uniref:Uncharacterized protein n=1 Tax=Ideonella lacteola TaxID=2984193 RepID=A0ABU9BXG1_9BURK
MAVLFNDQEDTFFVVGAELADPAYLNTLEQDLRGADPLRDNFGFGFSAHRLKVGEGLVLAYRHFSGGSINYIDDETYRKLTIWLRDPRAHLVTRQTVSFPGQGIVLLSSGGSAWPRNDCSGYVTGTAEITPLDFGLSIHVEGTFVPRGTRRALDECKSREVNLQFVATQARLSGLTPWQGGSGAKHPYAETYVH